jgi:hypothetical protein
MIPPERTDCAGLGIPTTGILMIGGSPCAAQFPLKPVSVVVVPDDFLSPVVPGPWHSSPALKLQGTYSAG